MATIPMTFARFTGLRVDQADASTIYVGYATPGALESDPVWRIMRITAVGTEIVIEYTGGTSDYNSVWDDRAILSYS